MLAAEVLETGHSLDEHLVNECPVLSVRIGPAKG